MKAFFTAQLISLQKPENKWNTENHWNSHSAIAVVRPRQYSQSSNETFLGQVRLLPCTFTQLHSSFLRSVFVGLNISLLVMKICQCCSTTFLWAASNVNTFGTLTLNFQPNVSWWCFTHQNILTLWHSFHHYWQNWVHLEPRRRSSLGCYRASWKKGGDWLLDRHLQQSFSYKICSGKGLSKVLARTRGQRLCTYLRGYTHIISAASFLFSTITFKSCQCPIFPEVG